MGAGLPQPHTTDPTRKPWTHKEAYEMHSRCKLVRGIDTVNPDREFGVPQSVDIWSICTPADEHLWAVEAMLKPADSNFRPLAIFCEKPLAPTIEECDTIIEWCKRRNIVLAVNHQRAWELGGTVEYSGDPLENGTHAAELANRLHMNLTRRDAAYAFLSISLYAGGPMVSLKAIDDIIDCIEGRKEKPACDGWAGREAVRVALESCQYAQAI